MAIKINKLTQTENIKTTDEMVILDGAHTLRTPSTALTQVLNAGNLKMPDSDETIAEHYRQFYNRTLLDNWYFANPVNQRGQTEYTGSGYTIDRWRLLAGTFTVTEVGITLQKGCSIQQVFEGKTFGTATMSILTSDNILKHATGTLVHGVTTWGINCSHIDGFWGGCRYIDNDHFEFRIFAEATDVTVIAAKLEFGSNQTLAHKENDIWVLNEIPNYATELAKCQRYQIPIKRWVAYPATWIDGNDVNCLIPTPVQMRVSPALQNLTWIIYDNETKVQHKDFSVSVYSVAPSGVALKFTKPNHGLSNVCVTSSTLGMLDANL